MVALDKAGLSPAQASARAKLAWETRHAAGERAREEHRAGVQRRVGEGRRRVAERRGEAGVATEAPAKVPDGERRRREAEARGEAGVSTARPATAATEVLPDERRRREAEARGEAEVGTEHAAPFWDQFEREEAARIAALPPEERQADMGRFASEAKAAADAAHEAAFDAESQPALDRAVDAADAAKRAAARAKAGDYEGARTARLEAVMLAGSVHADVAQRIGRRPPESPGSPSAAARAAEAAAAKAVDAARAAARAKPGAEADGANAQLQRIVQDETLRTAGDIERRIMELGLVKPAGSVLGLLRDRRAYHEFRGRLADVVREVQHQRKQLQKEVTRPSGPGGKMNSRALAAKSRALWAAVRSARSWWDRLLDEVRRSEEQSVARKSVEDVAESGRAAAERIVAGALAKADPERSSRSRRAWEARHASGERASEREGTGSAGTSVGTAATRPATAPPESASAVEAWRRFSDAEGAVRDALLAHGAAGPGGAIDAVRARVGDLAGQIDAAGASGAIREEDARGIRGRLDELHALLAGGGDSRQAMLHANVILGAVSDDFEDALFGETPAPGGRPEPETPRTRVNVRDVEADPWEKAARIVGGAVEKAAGPEGDGSDPKHREAALRAWEKRERAKPKAEAKAPIPMWRSKKFLGALHGIRRKGYSLDTRALSTAQWWAKKLSALPENPSVEDVVAAVMNEPWMVPVAMKNPREVEMAERTRALVNEFRSKKAEPPKDEPPAAEKGLPGVESLAEAIVKAAAESLDPKRHKAALRAWEARARHANFARFSLGGAADLVHRGRYADAAKMARSAAQRLATAGHDQASERARRAAAGLSAGTLSTDDFLGEMRTLLDQVQEAPYPNPGKKRVRKELSPDEASKRAKLAWEARHAKGERPREEVEHRPAYHGKPDFHPDAPKLVSEARTGDLGYVLDSGNELGEILDDAKFQLGRVDDAAWEGEDPHGAMGLHNEGAEFGVAAAQVLDAAADRLRAEDALSEADHRGIKSEIAEARRTLENDRKAAFHGKPHPGAQLSPEDVNADESLVAVHRLDNVWGKLHAAHEARIGPEGEATAPSPAAEPAEEKPAAEAPAQAAPSEMARLAQRHGGAAHGYFGGVTRRNLAHDEAVASALQQAGLSDAEREELLTSASGRHLADELSGHAAGSEGAAKAVKRAVKGWREARAKDAPEPAAEAAPSPEHLRELEGKYREGESALEEAEHLYHAGDHGAAVAAARRAAVALGAALPSAKHPQAVQDVEDAAGMLASGDSEHAEAGAKRLGEALDALDAARDEADERLHTLAQQAHERMEPGTERGPRPESEKALALGTGAFTRQAEASRGAPPDATLTKSLDPGAAGIGEGLAGALVPSHFLPGSKVAAPNPMSTRPF